MEHRRKIIPHLRLPLVIVAVLLVLQVFAPSRSLMYVLVVIVGAIAVSFYWALKLSRRVALDRERRYGWAQVGDILEERFTLRNLSNLPVLWAEVRDRSTLPGYTASRVASIDSGGYTRWLSEGECRRRGVFTLGPVEVRMGDPFGFFSVSLQVGEETSFVVYPVISSLPHLELPRGRAPGVVRTSLHAFEVTPRASSVRPYTPSDAPRRIHWRTTARRGSLYVKDHDREPAGDLWIILDLHWGVQAGTGEFSTEEYGVTLAASLADAMLRDNRAVGMMYDGGQHTMLRPEKGQTQLWRILRGLASVRAEGSQPFGRLLAQNAPILGGGLTAILITPSLNPEWLPALVDLQQRGLGMSVMLLDAASFGGRGQVSTMVGLLSDRGVAAQVIDRSYQFQPLVPPRKQRPTYKVLSTGRVIAIPSS